MTALPGRAPRGARGLKYYVAGSVCTRLRRAPRGARGLKCGTVACTMFCGRVAPLAGRVD